MNRKDLLVAGGVSVVLAFGWYQFVWQAQGASAEKASAELRAAKESVSKLTGQVTGLQRTKAELADKAELATRIEQAIPATPELSSLVKQLQATAKSRNVQLTSISAGQLAAAPATTVAVGATGGSGVSAASEMTLTLAMHGSYASIVEFVHDLDGIPRLVVVDSLTLSRNDTDAASGQAVAASDVSATVAAKVFSTALPPAADGSVPTTTVPGSSTSTTAKGGL